MCICRCIRIDMCIRIWLALKCVYVSYTYRKAAGLRCSKKKIMRVLHKTKFRAYPSTIKSTHFGLWAYVSLYVHVNRYVCICVHIYAYLYVYVYHQGGSADRLFLRFSLFFSFYLFVYICVCVYICMCVYNVEMFRRCFSFYMFVYSTYKCVYIYMCT